MQDSGKDLTDTWKAGFNKILAQDLVLGKKMVLEVEITEVREEGLLQKRSKNAGSGTPLPDPVGYGSKIACIP